MRTLRILLLGLLAFSSLPRDVFAQRDKVVVGVLQFDVALLGQKGSGDLSTTLVDMFNTEMGKQPNIQVVDKQQMQDVLTKQKLVAAGHVADEDMQRVGKILGADYFLIGQATVVGSAARLDIRLSNAETGEIARSVKESGKVDDLLDLVDKIVVTLTKDLKIPSKAAVLAAEQKGDPKSVAAVLAYSRGLDLEKRGKKVQAAEMYQKSLQMSPDYEDAQKALARVK